MKAPKILNFIHGVNFVVTIIVIVVLATVVVIGLSQKKHQKAKAFGPSLAMVEHELCDGAPINKRVTPGTKKDIGYERILCMNGTSARIIMLNPKTYAGALETNDKKS